MQERPSSRAERAREVYGRAFKSIRESQPDAKEEAQMVLEAWRDFEQGLTWRWVAAGAGAGAGAVATGAEVMRMVVGGGMGLFCGGGGGSA